MTGKYDNIHSWEKQSFYLLDNGWTATIENSYYGPMVTKLENQSGYWHCSNGLGSLPEFAKAWISPIALGHWQTIVKPMFEILYNTDDNVDTVLKLSKNNFRNGPKIYRRTFQVVKGRNQKI